jgi:hypothetical protein
MYLFLNENNKRGVRGIKTKKGLVAVMACLFIYNLLVMGAGEEAEIPTYS